MKAEETNRTNRERDLERVRERALTVFFSSVSKISSSMPSGPSSRSMSCKKKVIKTHTYSENPCDEDNLSIILYKCNVYVKTCLKQTILSKEQRLQTLQPNWLNLPAAGCLWSHPACLSSQEAVADCCSDCFQWSSLARKLSPALQWKWPVKWWNGSNVNLCSGLLEKVYRTVNYLAKNYPFKHKWKWCFAWSQLFVARSTTGVNVLFS